MQCVKANKGKIYSYRNFTSSMCEGNSRTLHGARWSREIFFSKKIYLSPPPHTLCSVLMIPPLAFNFLKVLPSYSVSDDCPPPRTPENHVIPSKNPRPLPSPRQKIIEIHTSGYYFLAIQHFSVDSLPWLLLCISIEQAYINTFVLSLFFIGHCLIGRHWNQVWWETFDVTCR